MISNEFFLNSGRKKALCLLIGLVAIPGLTIFFGEDTGADLKKLSNSEMRDVTGRSLVDLVTESGDDSWNYITSTTYDYTMTHTHGCFSLCGSDYTQTTTATNYLYETISNQNINFKRIELNADLEFSGGVDATRIGFYDDSDEIGPAESSESYYEAGGDAGNEEPDLQINDLDFHANGNVDGDATFRHPFVEFAFRNPDDNSTRELAGLRIGAEEVNGEMKFALDHVSGALHANCQGVLGTLGCAVLADNPLDIQGHRQTNVLADAADLANLDMFIEFNDTKDFWLSLQKEDMIWDHNNPATTTTDGNHTNDLQFHTDGKGFWLHFTDDVDARGPI